ncbi:acyl-CoA carboxylase subunit epsilon [Streptomyces sp. TG1A-60]|uniref:acyl-CoA carboxylase subunit epsilon n=1 Tax=Streptomyces sp. TG1A-60 TaxID=3129111 RepID=UPI0030D22B1E
MPTEADPDPSPGRAHPPAFERAPEQAPVTGADIRVVRRRVTDEELAAVVIAILLAARRNGSTGDPASARAHWRRGNTYPSPRSWRDSTPPWEW